MARLALLLAVEGAALVALAVLYAVKPLASRPDDLLLTELGALITLLGGAALLLLAAGMRRASGWARAPTLVLQLLALPVGFSLAFQAGRWPYGLPVLLLAGTVLYLLATPEARLALAERRRP